MLLIFVLIEMVEKFLIYMMERYTWVKFRKFRSTIFVPKITFSVKWHRLEGYILYFHGRWREWGIHNKSLYVIKYTSSSRSKNCICNELLFYAVNFFSTYFCIAFIKKFHNIRFVYVFCSVILQRGKIPARRIDNLLFFSPHSSSSYTYL